MAIWEMVKYYSSHRIIIVWSLVLFVYAEVTLRLRDDDAVVYGQPFSLVCFTTVNASSQYAVFYRYLDPSSNGILVAYITSNGSGFCHPSPSTLPNYTYSCNNDGKEITLTVPGDNLKEHDTSWRCANRGGTVLANNNKVSVFVKVPVSYVQLDPAGSITLNEFEYRTLTCTTSFCRPEAVISWWKNDVDITNMANSSIYNLNSTTGTLVYTGNRLDNGHSIVCKAWNGYGNQQTSQQTIVDIRYAPAGPPTIGSYLNGSVFSVIENMSQSLVCIVTGGNPLAYLSWKCFGLAMSSITVNLTVRSTISLTVNRTMDRQQCQCVSTQEIQGNRTAFVTVNVLCK